MKKKLLSVALATYNEEENIVDCIQSFKNITNEIIVVDGKSSDRTRDLAGHLGSKVIKTDNKPMFHINKNMAIDACTCDWILLMDADERVSDELAKEIIRVISNYPKENGFWINRKNWFLGGYLKKGGAYPDRVVRLFRKGKGRLPEKSVHEQVKVDGQVGYLKNDILHLADPNFSRYLKRAIRYTDRTADDLERDNIGNGIGQIINYMLLKPTTAFLKIYIRHKGFQDGFRGFVWALFSASHYFYAYVKYWHSEQSKSPKTH